jgi:iron(III) transport system substrate-binding protein
LLPQARIRLAFFGLGGIAAVAAAALLACDGRGRTPVVVYSPHGRDLLTALERAYEAVQPAVDVRWLDMGSQEVYDRVRSEGANPQADVWFGGPESIVARGAAEGLLESYRPPWADALPEAAGDPQGRFFGSYRTLTVLVYNRDAVAEADAPRDWDDLLEPRFAGQVLVRDPPASGTMRTLFAMVLGRSLVETGGVERGFEWLRRLDAQTKEYVPNPALLFQKLARREGLVTVWELSDILVQQRQGLPFGFRLAASGTPVVNDAVGLVRSAPHAEAARGFIDWVGSREAQLLAAREAFKLPARADLPPEELPEWARQVLGELRPAEVDWRQIDSQIPAWMATWDRSVRGRG